MYGTRAAADGWQQEYSGFMKHIVFIQGEASPCMFVHENQGIACSVHGDDFTSTGPKVGLDWLEAQLEGKYELRKGCRLGSGPDDAAELTVLNQALRYTSDGFEYEADPRQAEKLLEGLGLDDNCNKAATSGLKPLTEQLVVSQGRDIASVGPHGVQRFCREGELSVSRSYRLAVLRQRDLQVYELPDRHVDDGHQEDGSVSAGTQAPRIHLSMADGGRD